MSQLQPILMSPVLAEKPWGGRRLARYGKDLPDGLQIGESWEVADLPAEAVSTVDDPRSRVASGPFTGMSLRDLIARFGEDFLGCVSPTEEGDFPLLVKLLDAREHLSVQVHPDRKYVKKHPQTRLKTESWYVVAADPDAHLYLGLRDGVAVGDVAARLGTAGIVGLLNTVPAVPGDFHHLPAGLVHALGAGVLVAEVQTPSDTTFRVYDWGRTDREIHVAAALECIEYGPVTADAREGSAERQGGDGERVLVTCPHFGIAEWRGGSEVRRRLDIGAPEVWMVIGGSIEIRSASDGYDPVRAGTGQTVLMPASLGPTAVAGDAGLVMLRVTLPKRGTTA